MGINLCRFGAFVPQQVFGLYQSFYFTGLVKYFGIKNLYGAGNLILIGFGDVLIANEVHYVVIDLLARNLTGLDVIVVHDKLSKRVFIRFDCTPTISF